MASPSREHTAHLCIIPQSSACWLDIRRARHNIDPMALFWSALETHCVAGCCGIDAFNLWPEEIRRAAREVPDPNLRSKIIVLRAFVAGCDAENFVSSRLNNLFRRSVLLEVLDHIEENLRSVE